MQDRLNQNDVTNRVNVEDPQRVRDAVLALYAARYPGIDLAPLDARVRRLPGPVRRHLPRLPRLRHALPRHAPHARHDARDGAPGRRPRPQLRRADRLGAAARDARRADRAAARLGLPAAQPEGAIENGAVFTRTHVSRGAEFIAAYLPTLGFGAEAPVAARLVHFTGYEMEIEDIRVERSARPHGRLPGGRRRPDRPDVGPHVPGEMPRVPLQGVRLGQDRARAPARRPRGGALRLARGPDHQDAGLLRVRGAHAPARRSWAASTATPRRISTARASTRPRSTATWISCARRSRPPTSTACAAPATPSPPRPAARPDAVFHAALK